MSIAERTQSRQHTPSAVAAHHGSVRNYGRGIAVASGAVGAAVALIGAGLGSLPMVVAAALLLGAGAFLTAACSTGR